MSAGPKLGVMHHPHNSNRTRNDIEDNSINSFRLLSPPTDYCHYSRKQFVKSFTWLVFLNEKWVPFDPINQTKLEHTLTVEGTFVDITDSHFPNVRRVRVFPKNNYLSYLGVKYRLSRIMQPDAYLHLTNSSHDNSCHSNNSYSNSSSSSSSNSSNSSVSSLISSYTKNEPVGICSVGI
ncbi:hypothetical protein RMATCC62417_00866 [Rhizopus microsporus]|nr:hypothetical protein RMATCC62417_00866 [Rhizopus microsporus]